MENEPDTLTGLALNTDRELWREREGDYYADSLFVTEHGGIGMNVGGTCYVLPIQAWHALAAAANPIPSLAEELAAAELKGDANGE